MTSCQVWRELAFLGVFKGSSNLVDPELCEGLRTAFLPQACENWYTRQS